MRVHVPVWAGVQTAGIAMRQGTDFFVRGVMMTPSPNGSGRLPRVKHRVAVRVIRAKGTTSQQVKSTSMNGIWKLLPEVPRVCYQMRELTAGGLIESACCGGTDCECGGQKESITMHG